jgi:two-component system OmpR family response regulator
MEPTKILVVDDEPNIRDLLASGLRFAGFSVLAVGNGNDAVAAAEKGKPDLILLDVMLPDMSGFSVTKKLRSMNILAPVLFLTARDEVEDKITGLTVGGDDYMTKPFSLDEIIARINAILRRTKQGSMEKSVIRYLMENANRVLSKSQILDHVWEYDFNGEMGIVESYISYLRKKLDPLTSEPVLLTKRGHGYMFKSTKKI